MGLNKLYQVRPHLKMNWDIRFWFLVGLAGIYAVSAYLYKRLNKARLIVSSISIAFTLMAMSIMIKFPRLNIGFFWILEMLILFTLGIYYKELVYRVLAVILNIFILLRLFFVDFFSIKYYTIFGLDIKHNVLIFTFATLVFFLLDRLTHSEKVKKILSEGEARIYKSFSVIGAVLAMLIIGKEVRAKWITLMFVLEGICLVIIGFLFSHRIYRICALCVFSLASLRLIFVDMAGVDTIYRILAFLILGAVLLSTSFIYSKFMIKEK
jgi:hypothetical protein